MLEIARARLLRHWPSLEKTDFLQANLVTWRTDAAFDLIVTHFVLDCFPPDQLRQAVANLASAATPRACWLLADFQMPSGRIRRVRGRLIHTLMYAFFRKTTGLAAHRLVPPDASLMAHGFALRRRECSDWGLLHSDLWERRVTTRSP
jgi:hypothetical protein